MIEINETESAVNATQLEMRPAETADNVGAEGTGGQPVSAPGQEQPRSIENGTQLLASDGVVYVVSNLQRSLYTVPNPKTGEAVKLTRKDGSQLDRQTLTLRRVHPKIRGKVAVKARKHARRLEREQRTRFIVDDGGRAGEGLQ